ncbi:hypothetical protein GTP55_07300 [Duganella sp. FT109W]|uniref:Uncharacterized protein n=1 Tax=Duganella margarita TaxID=2692170 RepID=A0ABW9WDX7_9BURK|nr:hypothetical protein [Duganella margarita]MYN39174.1 hypothetical protein [Duganella margarita]
MTTQRDEMFQAILPSLKVAFDAGFAQGFEAGRAIGLVEGINAMTPAVSDGLRHGSGACGRAMQSLKNLGLDTGENTNEADDEDEDDEDEDDEDGSVVI